MPQRKAKQEAQGKKSGSDSSLHNVDPFAAWQQGSIVGFSSVGALEPLAQFQQVFFQHIATSARLLCRFAQPRLIKAGDDDDQGCREGRPDLTGGLDAVQARLHHRAPNRVARWCRQPRLLRYRCIR